MTSYLKTGVLLAGLTGLFAGVGWLLGGAGGMMIAFLIAVAMNAMAWWNADKMVLRMYGAREVDARTAPELHGMVARLAQRAGLPMPRVYLIDSDQPNAFATGRNPENAAVAATTGLLRALTPEEVAGVMAHELAHVKNRDTLVMTITATVAGAISMIANFGLFFGPSHNSEGEGGGSPLGWVGALLVALLAPMAAMVVQMAISRTREHEADRIGAEICGRPGWLADALEKIEAHARRIPNARAEANPATAHLFIANPLNAGPSGRAVAGLFSTHPSTVERVGRLRAMAARNHPPPTRGPWSTTPRRTGSVPSAGTAGRRGPWG